MKISEQTGRLVGFLYDSDGFQFQADACTPFCARQSYYFPFNENRPKAFDPDEFRGKKVKITVEMLDD